MNEPFLLQAAKHYSRLLKDAKPGYYTFVFPNRRSSLFFKKYLGEVADGAMFVPHITTISEMFQSLSGLQLADTPTQLFELWKVYNKLNGSDEEGESLDDFLTWGSLILSDFSDIDQYLVDAKQLFTNIKEQKEIQSDTSYLTDDQVNAIRQLVGMREGADTKEFKKRFFGVWDNMYNVYKEYNERLKEKGLAYGAMQYRVVAEAVVDKSIIQSEPYASIRKALDAYNKVVFIGFSAPSNCEKALMRFFRNRKTDDGEPSGEFLWDYYSSKVKDENNRASSRISLCVKEFPNTVEFPYNESGCGMSEKEKLPDEKPERESSDRCQYNVIKATGKAEQTRILSVILKEIASEDGWNAESEAIKSAVVVSDESMLFPILTSVPDDFIAGEEKLVNITMPYPLKATPIASLESMLAELNINMRLVDGKPLLLGKDVVNILDHPYVRTIDPAGCRSIISRITEKNQYFINTEIIRDEILSEDGGKPIKITDKLEKFVTGLIIPKKGMVEALKQTYEGTTLITDIVEYQCNLLSFLEDGLAREDKGYLYKYVDALNSLANSTIPIKRLRTAYNIIRSVTSQQSISFVGEPLRGLQIMGPLETRLLDFENIIFLSFNEGYFPANGQKNSVIPYFLRKVFGLPTYEDNDSVSSYNFYRLIQRAKRIYFIYDTDNGDDATSVKEPSRFIRQLEYLYGERLNLREFVKPTPVLRDSPLKVGADEISRDFFDSYRPHRLSASSLKNYLACPAKFYFSKILNIIKEDDLTESVDAKSFGSIFHNCMQHIYDDVRDNGKTVFTKKVLDQLTDSLLRGGGCKTIERYIDEAFKETMNVRRIDGENLVIKELVKDYIIKLLNVDRTRISGIDTTSAERSFNVIETESQCNVKLFGKRFIGYFDRVDEISGVLVISDYKTGKVDIPPVLTGRNSERFEFKERNFSPTFPEFTWTEENLPELLNNYIIPFEEAADEFPRVMLSEKRDSFYDIAFQILLYASMYRERCRSLQKPVPERIDVAIYPLRHISGKGMITAHLTDGAIDVFDERLERLLYCLEMDCKERGFIFNNVSTGEKGNVCHYCDFKKFCNK